MRLYIIYNNVSELCFVVSFLLLPRFSTYYITYDDDIIINSK